MAGNPLLEVFGYPPNNMSAEAKRHRDNKLCPYNNKVPSCTKDKASDPLGVCSITNGGKPTITCPVRFRQDWIVATDSAEFFGFQPGSWTSLQEMRLNDANGVSAGNIDLVIAEYDLRGRITNFGSVEIQAVYISGNVRRPFEHYMKDPVNRQDMDWRETQVRADYLSSSRKRLMPQLTFKGSILKSWNKLQAVALHRTFWETLPAPPTVERDDAEIAWFIYDTVKDAVTSTYRLVRNETVYTRFDDALLAINSPVPGRLEDFEGTLQKKLDAELSVVQPDAPTLGDVFTTEDD